MSTVTNMAGGQTADPYLAIVRTEVATELLNSARALIYERIYQLEDGSEADRQEANRLDAKAADLYRLLRSLNVQDQAGIDRVIAQWGPLVSSETLFWPELEKDRPPIAA